jgi:cellulose synthase/poly-beta-1,6-N-acetylglucosamine synthase-like glycosyltransferase
MRLSIIVPARNSQATLEPCLQAIRAAAPAGAELIVADDASDDATAMLAKNLGARVVSSDQRQGPAAARRRGAGEAQGDVLAFVDSDVIVRSDSFTRILSCFDREPGVGAVTGLLSTEHPNRDFWSQYKNLYMNYIFRRSPEEATFLYGSVFAIRAPLRVLMLDGGYVGEDTALGQSLVIAGHRIRLLKDLDVVHLKRYTFTSWIRNDFRVPFHWGRLFSAGAWRQLGRGGGGFAHASWGQLVSLPLAALTLLMVGPYPAAAAATALAWLIINGPFLFFLGRHRGILFGLESVPATFLDHLIMATGTGCGILSGLGHRK